MRQRFTILGIDLGGCMSATSAYLYADVGPDSFEIIEAFKEPRHKEHLSCERFLLDAFRRRRVDAIAVDAPLGLPLPLIDPSARSPKREGSGEILNPLLFRHTDYWLYREYGLRPMPPAGDRIGRLTARMVSALRRCDYRFPTVALGGGRVPLFEVYPRQIAQFLGVEKRHKEPRRLFEALDAPFFECDEHTLDAMLCAWAGYKILNGDTVQPGEYGKKEGWCFPVV